MATRRSTISQNGSTSRPNIALWTPRDASSGMKWQLWWVNLESFDNDIASKKLLVGQTWRHIGCVDCLDCVDDLLLLFLRAKVICQQKSEAKRIAVVKLFRGWKRWDHHRRKDKRKPSCQYDCRTSKGQPQIPKRGQWLSFEFLNSKYVLNFLYAETCIGMLLQFHSFLNQFSQCRSVQKILTITTGALVNQLLTRHRNHKY